MPGGSDRLFVSKHREEYFKTNEMRETAGQHKRLTNSKAFCFETKAFSSVIDFSTTLKFK